MSNQSIDLNLFKAKDGSLWIFGYGSLTWKVNFPYKSSKIGYIKGYARRLWQGSTDHRGIPGHPGRVATLIKNPDVSMLSIRSEVDFCDFSNLNLDKLILDKYYKEITWGIAYQIESDYIEKVINYLNFREKCGYTTDNVTFYPSDGTNSLENVLIYIATEDNEEFLGPASLREEAMQIISSSGPSGQNSEYLLRLAEAMRKIGITDRYLFDLEQQIRELMVQS